MQEIKVKKSDFEFKRFVDAIADFIEETFGSDSPEETMRYFYFFKQSFHDCDDPELSDINNKMRAVTKKYNNEEISKDEFDLIWMVLIQDEFLRKEVVNRERFQKRNRDPFIDKDPEEWEMKDFKDAVLKGGESIFFPFSSGLDEDGSVSLVSGKTVQLGDTDEAEGEDSVEGDGDEAEAEDENPSIGMTDCFGILVNLADGKFIFNSAIAWGDQASSIELADHSEVDPAMKKFLKHFIIKKCKKKTL